MIVNRRTFNVRQGRMEELVALVLGEIAAASERGSYTGAMRVYTSSIGTFDQLAVEWEYEDLAAYERMWAEWAARPTTATFMQTFLELTKGAAPTRSGRLRSNSETTPAEETAAAHLACAAR